MGRRKQVTGKCGFCGYEETRGKMTRHLAKCSGRQGAIEKSDRKKAKPQTLYHLLVQDAWGGDFWLHLEMEGKAKLGCLDEYLRDIWLECCSHMSEFFVGKIWGEEVSMDTPAGRIFSLVKELFHVYDFGTSSETVIKVVDKRQGKPLTNKPITLMARNTLPEVTCMKCDQPAQWMCQECQIEHDESGFLCNKHVKKHPHDDYGEPLAIVNSPRLGMCGYDGPADPPY
jgi:hypothetical protein